MILSRMFFSVEKEIKAQLSDGAELRKIELPQNLKGLYCFQLSKTNSDGLVMAGLGSDFNLNLAYTKCLVEYLERRAFFEEARNSGFTSTNGIAGHFFSNLAKKNADAELFERDSFLLHWYSQTPFVKLDCSNLAINEFQRTNSNYNLQFYRTFLGDMTTVCCFIIYNTTGGFVVGLSSGKKNISAEMEKAFSEAIINLYFGSGGVEVKEYDGSSLSSLADHRNYWLQRKLPQWFANQSDLNSVRYQDLPHSVISSFEKNYGNIVISGVIKSNLFGIKVGLPTEYELILLKSRLISDKIRNMNLNDLLPHPIP